MALLLSTPSRLHSSTVRARRTTVNVHAAAWTKVTTKTQLAEAGGKSVFEVGGQKVLIVDVDGEVFAVSNKCSHLGLPLVGKTALFQGKVANKCIVCPAHNTAFDLATGAVKGEWCPTFPNMPLVGKMTPSKPLPTFESRVDEQGNVEVLA